MTSHSRVALTATVPFKPPVTDDGFVIIRKANPSGDRSHATIPVEVPIKFSGNRLTIVNKTFS